MTRGRFADTAALLVRAAEEHQVPGLAAGAVVDGEVAHLAVHGWRDLGGRLPMTTETPSRWYSISKPLTALALAQQVAAGRLRWDRPLASLLPGVEFADPVVTARAEVGDCLLHRTGLPTGDWVWVNGPNNPDELLRRMRHLPCSVGFRAAHAYQNLGFTVLGQVLGALGHDWHQAMLSLLAPLGVHPQTRLHEFAAADRALGYGPNGFTPPICMPDFDFEGIAPASAVCGSITELAQVARMMARSGAGVLPRALWDEVTQGVLVLPDSEWPELRHHAVALAGRVAIYRGERVLTWAGGHRGYVAHLLALPDRRAAACAMANRGSSMAAELLAWSMLDRALEWEPLPWADRFLARKRAMRRTGEARLAARLARPTAPWPVRDVCGVYHSPAYGELRIDVVEDTPRLSFRGVDLPLVPRPGGTLSADGPSIDFSEVCWDIRPLLIDERMAGLDFGPDDPGMPCRFVRTGQSNR
jgi:CubicO group peptidase (beta-lactamase class C family)